MSCYLASEVELRLHNLDASVSPADLRKDHDQSGDFVAYSGFYTENSLDDKL